MTGWRFKVLYDGECPYCRLEARWLGYLGRSGHLALEDIAAPDFDPTRYGVTLPEFRGRGLYRATVAKRAELARARGYRWLYSDALPTSRPILERVGFVKLTTTRPFVFASRDPAASMTD